MKLVRSVCAREDLLDIWTYIYRESPKAADSVVDRIDERCRQLVAFPELGVVRDDIRKGLRCLTAGSYLILYRLARSRVTIVRVVRGKRDLDAA